MRRILGLWLVLLAIELAAFVLIGGVALRQINLRFDAILGALLAPAVQAALLVAFVPALRDRNATSPREALQAKGVVAVAGFVLALILLVTAANVLRLAPNGVFDYTRGGMLLAAAVAFARGHRYGATTLFALLGFLSGHFEQISEHVFPTQPLTFRWLVCFVPLTVIMLVALLAMTKNRTADNRQPTTGSVAAVVLKEREEIAPPLTGNERTRSDARRKVTHASSLMSPAASALGTQHSALSSANALLETALAPAAAAALIVIASYYLRPFIPPTWLLLANILSLAAAGIVLLSGVAATARRP